MHRDGSASPESAAHWDAVLCCPDDTGQAGGLSAEHTGVLNEDQPDSTPISPPAPFSAPESWGHVLAEDPG